MEKQKLYENQIQLTSQFRFCGNAFRIDTYRGCSFGCKYCFANNRAGKNFEGKVHYQLGNNKIIRDYFYKIDDRKKYADINVELMRHYVPLHLGGMCDPFQHREWQYERTFYLLKLSKRFNYPIIISTKTAHLPDKYWDILDPKLHTFQISLISYDDVLINKLEANTPKPADRINFIKELKNKGFWVSLRLQPLVSLPQAKKLLNELAQHIDYCTIEHLKLPKFNDKVWEPVLNALDFDYKANMRSTKDKPEFELNTLIKFNNINELKHLYPSVKFGCGDNDLHEYSDSLNCCGVDTMPPAFNNWLKYNSMVIKMTGNRDNWYPKSNCSGSFNSASVVKGFNFKDYVDIYYIKHYDDDDQQKLF